MKTQLHFTICKGILILIPGCLFFGEPMFAQQTKITDYVIFGGQKTSILPQTAPLSPGYAVQIGSTCNIQGGSIGSYNLVKSTGNLTLGTNIFSGGTIQLANSNVVSGKVSAANQFTLPSPLPAGSTILSVGSSTNIDGNIDVNGNIVIGGGTISGIVTHSIGTTYSGPVPTGGPGAVVEGTPNLPTLPDMPAITTFPAVGSTNISTTKTIAPGSYGDVTLGGNKTLTFSGAGVYVFNSIQNSGTSNNFVFDFKNLAGKIKIYVYGNIDLGKIKASITGAPAGAESRIFLETHGKGISASNPVAFGIANGSAGSASKWVGTVWAPYAAINIGSGTGSTNLTGALWSGTQVNLQSGISMVFAPFNTCDPTILNVGPDRPLDFSSVTTLRDSLNNAISYNWRTIGGVITSDPSKSFITVSSAGLYIVTADSTANCFARDTVKVSSRLKSLIGSELQSIFDNNTSTSPFFVIKPDTVTIDVIVNAGYKAATYDTLIKPAYGLVPDTLSNGTSSFIITGRFPIKNLPKLNFLVTQINYCRPYYQGVNNGGFVTSVNDTCANGLVTSAGDTSVRSWLVRKGYNLDGDGIKIGVISNSYNTITSGSTSPVITNTAAQDISNGDLPGPGTGHGVAKCYTKPVHVLKDLLPGPPRSDEGRAMAQIIHDVAPGAELYFHTGSITAGNFAQGIKRLRDSACNIIVDDITYMTEPFLKDGIVANAVNEVKSSGVTYFSAAGNFFSRSYENNFLPVPPPAGFTGSAHDFGGGDRYDSVTLSPGDYTIVLQWVDSIHSIGQGGTKNDLDIYLTPNTDGTALFGFNRDNTDGDPIEFIPFTVTSTTKTNILIVNNTAGSNPARFKVIIFRGNIAFNEHTADRDSSTLVGQANATGAIAIGAVRYDKATPYPGPLTAESFTSTGGTFVNGVQRNKPELAGPDGVNTTVNMGIDYDHNLYANFFGTSAAAPHAAAVAALIMQGRKKFLAGHPATSPDEMKSLLQLTATSMRPPGLIGYDFTSGSGLINADSAMRTFAAPTPFEIDLVVPTGTIPGSVPFTLTVTGENFSNNSKVAVVNNGDTTYLVPDLIYPDNSKLTVLLNTFSGNPEVLVYTPPKTAFGDGGFSNSLRFFEADIVIKAVDTSMKYGQTIPAFKTSITINGKRLQDTTLTLKQLGLDSLTLDIPDLAKNPGNVGTYIVTPGFDPNHPPADSLLEKYNYKFIPGTLTIEKLPLTITAQNITANYGDKIPDATFTYLFNSTNIKNPDSLLNTISSAHHNSLVKDVQGHDVLGLVNGQAVTIENGQAVTIENGQAVTIENGQAVTIENGVEVPVVNAQALTIVNGVVTDTSGIHLDSLQIGNLSFLVTDSSLKNTRQITNRTGTTSVVDITQESILDFNVNAAQTSMLKSVSNVDSKGLADVISYTNGQAVTIENGQAVTIENGQAVTIENGHAVVIENGQAVTIENGVAVPIVSSHNRTAVIIDTFEIGDGISNLKSLNTITGLAAGKQFIIPGTFSNSNFDIIYIAGKVTINKSVITVKADNITRQYGDLNPPLTVTYSGFVLGDNLQNSVTGVPSLSTTALQTSPAGTYPITPGIGTLASSNYTFSMVNGILTITDNCLLTRAPFNNFGSTPNPQSPTSVWLDITTKVSGQLKKVGDSLLFSTGTVTFNDIMATDPVTNGPITTAFIPRGVIIADNVPGPVTHYDADRKTWITLVPVGFASTSDIFITAAIVNSSNGFVKKKNNANSNTVVKGYFYSNTTYSDQWTYGLATYRPIFDYPSIAGSGQVVAINGTYRAGTPIPQIANLVNGGSGGGGNNYTGSTSSFDNFTACPIGGSPVTRVSNSVQEESQESPSAGEVQIIPNPASDHITLSFVPIRTGSSKIVVFTIDGKMVSETDNGIWEAGKKYLKRIDVSKMISGVYLVQLRSVDKIVTKKIIINR